MSGRSLASGIGGIATRRDAIEVIMVEVDNGFAPLSWYEHPNGLGQLRPKKGAH